MTELDCTRRKFLERGEGFIKLCMWSFQRFSLSRHFDKELLGRGIETNKTTFSKVPVDVVVTSLHHHDRTTKDPEGSKVGNQTGGKCIWNDIELPCGRRFQRRQRWWKQSAQAFIFHPHAMIQERTLVFAVRWNRSIIELADELSPP